MQNKKSRNLVRPLLGAAQLAVAAPSFAADSGSDWEYGGEIYIWGAAMTATTPGGRESELPFYDILNKLQMTFMGAGGARNDKWSMIADVIYLDVKDKETNDRTGPGGNGATVNSSVDLKSWIVTPTVGYAVHSSEKARVEILGGVRYLWMRAAAEVYFDDVEKFNKSTSQSYWDAIVGMRATVNLSDKWFIPLYFDIGTGDSKGTWQGLAGVGYKFNKVRTTLAYRYLDYNFKDTNKVLGELNVKGVFLSFGFRF